MIHEQSHKERDQAVSSRECARRKQKKECSDLQKRKSRSGQGGRRKDALIGVWHRKGEGDALVLPGEVATCGMRCPQGSDLMNDLSQVRGAKGGAGVSGGTRRGVVGDYTREEEGVSFGSSLSLFLACPEVRPAFPTKEPSQRKGRGEAEVRIDESSFRPASQGRVAMRREKSL